MPSDPHAKAMAGLVGSLDVEMVEKDARTVSKGYTCSWPSSRNGSVPRVCGGAAILATVIGLIFLSIVANHKSKANEATAMVPPIRVAPRPVLPSTGVANGVGVPHVPVSGGTARTSKFGMLGHASAAEQRVSMNSHAGNTFEKPKLGRRGPLAAGLAAVIGWLFPNVQSVAESYKDALAARTIGQPVISGGQLPLTVGYGTRLIPPNQVKSAIELAIKEGYRLFDTAQEYSNEKGIGEALAEAFANGRLARKDVFVTTTVLIDKMRRNKTISSVLTSDEDLGKLEGGIDLVLMLWADLPLMHGLLRHREREQAVVHMGWDSLQKLKEQGTIKQIGVANFDEQQLQELLEYAKIKPSVNQFEVHPYNQEKKLVSFCQKEGVAVNAYSPLGGKGNNARQVTDELLRDPVLKGIGQAHGKDVPQVILRWLLQRGITPVPKSSTPSHIRSNFEVFDFELTEQEMMAIAKLDRD